MKRTLVAVAVAAVTLASGCGGGTPAAETPVSSLSPTASPSLSTPPPSPVMSETSDFPESVPEDEEDPALAVTNTVDVTAGGFKYRLDFYGVQQSVTNYTGKSARPGFHFPVYRMMVTNLQDDRPADFSVSSVLMWLPATPAETELCLELYSGNMYGAKTETPTAAERERCTYEEHEAVVLNGADEPTDQVSLDANESRDIAVLREQDVPVADSAFRKPLFGFSNSAFDGELMVYRVV